MIDIGGVYQYIAMGFGVLFLVPQIFHGYRRGSLQDVSTSMLVFIVIGTSLWGYYMYESQLKLYLYATGFLCANALILLFMQFFQYYGRFQEHVRTFEPKPAPAPAPQIIVTQQPLSVPLVQEPVQCEQISVDIEKNILRKV
jgi:uncharacterized protein with PQ loop repeat